MCGLVGMVFKAQSGGTIADANTFEQLLYIDALRGDDSTGVAALYNDGSIKVLKEATSADYFRCTKEYNSFYQTVSILGEEDVLKKVFRVQLSQKVAATIKLAFSLLGINVPDRM